MNLAETLGAVVGVASIIGGLAVWAMRSTVAPLRVVIENNTRVMERIEGRLDEHAEKLVDHGERIVRIETTHNLEARE